LLSSAAAAPLQIIGGMVDPEVDPPNQPFSYFQHPTDVLGTLFAPAASQVTPEGYLYTGFGELMFFVGNPPRPVEQRIRTLYKDYLPIVQYQVEHLDLEYSFTMFAADLKGELEGLPVNFVKVEVRNPLPEERAAFFSTAYRFLPPVNNLRGVADYRFRQKFEVLPQKYVEGQTTFNPDWKYDFGPNHLVRDDRILYWFPVEHQPAQLSLTLNDTGLRMVRFFTGEISGNPNPKLTLYPQIPMGVVMYRLPLKPGESKSLVFKMPIVPLPQGSTAAEQVNRANYDEHFRATAESWEALVSRNFPLRIPEEKVQQVLQANTVFNLLAIDKIGDDYIPHVNKFQYHRYWAGDTDFMLNGLTLMGLGDIARKGFLYRLKIQRADGAILLPWRDAPDADPFYWENFGWSVYGWTTQYMLTRDRDYLETIYPAVVKAVEFAKSVTRRDPLGLIPPPSTEISDDAFLKKSRQTSGQIWTLIGLKNAIKLARAMGKNDDVAAFQAEYDRFWKAFEKHLSAQTEKSGGYIPPAMEETLEGNDWDNMHLLWPEILFDPFDPRVTATIRKTRSEYQEGILRFIHPRALAIDRWPVEREGRREGGYIFQTQPVLHYWQTQNNSHNALVRGGTEDQENAVRDIYAQLLHTSSTHAPGEFGTYPWSTRDHEGANTHDILPDGTASGKIIPLIRNMIVREQDEDLYLLSAVSPLWLQSPRQIEANKLPTGFGPLTMSVRAKSDGWEIHLSHDFWEAPRRILVRIPWFCDVQRVEVDGKPATVTDGHLILDAGNRQVRITGKVKPGTPEMSFERTVEEYKTEYRKRYQEFLRTGVVRLH